MSPPGLPDHPGHAAPPLRASRAHHFQVLPELGVLLVRPVPQDQGCSLLLLLRRRLLDPRCLRGHHRFHRSASEVEAEAGSYAK
jgi:hypothetical protein